MNEVIDEWINKAEDDWRVANREFKVVDEPSFSAVCYHAQQCAEKYMKALLISKNIRPEYTHDLIKLNDKIQSLIYDWIFDEEKLYFLTTGGIQFRYPGDSPDIDDADYCLEICKEIREQKKNYSNKN
jgi:HEPN domain-containing protein